MVTLVVVDAAGSLSCALCVRVRDASDQVETRRRVRSTCGVLSTRNRVAQLRATNVYWVILRSHDASIECHFHDDGRCRVWQPCARADH